MPFIELNTGATLFFEQAGCDQQNIPIIAIHGMLGTGETHLSHVIRWLADEGYCVYAPTMRGYGQSLPKPRDFPLDFYFRDADDVLAFMDALKIEQAHVMGYSDGGEIALVCAGKQPERFVSVSVWGAVGYFGSEMRPVAQRMLPANWLTEEQMQMHGIPNANAFVAGWVRATVYAIDKGGDVSLSLAPNISCPVLMMLGEEDTLNPAKFARHYLEYVQDGRLEMFKCGHPIHDEQPEAFRAVVGEFLGSIN